MLKFFQIFCKNRVVIAFGISLFVTLTSPLSAQDYTDEWTRQVREFRKDHHFALVTGYHDASWTFKNAPGFKEKTVNSKGASSIFEWTFNIQTWEKFGFNLGTSFGGSKDLSFSSSSFSSDIGILLPNGIVGVTFNFTPKYILNFSVFGGLERWDALKLKDPDQEAARYLSLTIESYGYKAFFDCFFSLTQGIRFEYFDKISRHTGTTNDSSDNYGSQTIIAKKERMYALGYLIHLL